MDKRRQSGASVLEKATAFSRVRALLAPTGWNERAVDEASEILESFLSVEVLRRQSKVIQSRTSILENWRYLEYWYFEGAPLSVQIALYVGIELNLLMPPDDQREKLAEFTAFFRAQFAFKSALSASEVVGGWLFPGEAELLWEGVRQTKDMAGSICEIGSWTGRSTILLAAACAHYSPRKAVHIVDDWMFGGKPSLYPYLSDGRGLRDEFEQNLAPWRNLISIHEGEFGAVYENLENNCPDGLSLAFHDAGHNSEDFERDLGLVAPLLRDGGLLFIHDYVSKNFPSGREAIDKWLEREEAFVIEKVVGSCAQIRKA